MTEQELDELVKRLTQPISSRLIGQYTYAVHGNPDGKDAAAAIQFLREQVKGLEKERDEARTMWHQALKDFSDYRNSPAPF